MAMLTSLDFGFRRGSKDELLHTKYRNGTFNFCKDTRELYIDIDDARFQISSIVFDAGTEAEIRALARPENKIYIASDTNNLLYYRYSKLKWIVLNSTSFAEQANCDSEGNKIDTYYLPIDTFQSSILKLSNNISDLSSKLENIESTLEKEYYKKSEVDEKITTLVDSNNAMADEINSLKQELTEVKQTLHDQDIRSIIMQCTI